MDRARLFALEADVVPLVESSVDTESRELDGSLTDEVRGSDIFIPALDFHVVTDVLDVNVEHLVPFRGLASTLHSLGLELLHACLNRDVWVHFGEEFGVSSESGLDDRDSEGSSSCHKILFVEL